MKPVGFARIAPEMYMRMSEIDLSDFRSEFQRVPITTEQLAAFWHCPQKWKLSGQVICQLDPTTGYDETQTFDFTVDGPEIERALVETPSGSGRLEPSLMLDPVDQEDDPGYLSWDLRAIDFGITSATHYFGGTTSGIIGAKLTLRAGQWFFPNRHPDTVGPYATWSELGGLIQCDLEITGEAWQSEPIGDDFDPREVACITRAQGTTMEGGFPTSPTNGIRFNLESDTWTRRRPGDVVSVSTGCRLAPSLWLPYELDGSPTFDSATGVRI